MKKVLDSYMVLCVLSWGSILLEQDMLKSHAGNPSDWLPEFRDNNDNGECICNNTTECNAT